METKRKQELLEELVERLFEERGASAPLTSDVDELWTQFRALVNTRPPVPADADWLAMQDELLQGMIAEAGVSDVEDAAASPLDARLRLWRGDITTLAVDAIVNAANSQMLGCWAPGHHCIDNAIHTFSGVQLRAECARIMAAQGHEEPTGMAKITPAYNLPAKHVIHTVGPIANGRPTQEHREQLAASYRSCLDVAAQNGLHSIAFCCISTGVFGFPQEEAAGIAVETVRDWLARRDGRSEDGGRAVQFSNSSPSDNSSHGMTVVFNVFSSVDEELYRNLLGC